jgi:phosphoribosyl-ATP pyrophosphohydrolase
MKTFEELFRELKGKLASQESGSKTVAFVNAGVHEVGKKLLEEAGESWLAAEYEGRDKTAEELSHLLYFTQVMMLCSKIELEDVYKHL